MEKDIPANINRLRQNNGEHKKSRIIYPSTSPWAHEVGKLFPGIQNYSPTVMFRGTPCTSSKY